MVGVDVPVEVNVGVDPAGHDGLGAEVVSGLVAGGTDGSDAAVFDDDLPVARDAAAAVEDGAGADDAGLSGGEGGRRRMTAEVRMRGIVQ
jgi:hypothetical protein